MATRPRSDQGRAWVAVILAIGIATAINLITGAVLYDAIAHPEQAGLSENATQVLTAAFGGIVGVLGAYFGFQAGRDASAAQAPPQAQPTVELLTTAVTDESEPYAPEDAPVVYEPDATPPE